MSFTSITENVGKVVIDDTLKAAIFMPYEKYGAKQFGKWKFFRTFF